MKHVREFVRSVLPADHAQLLLLAGVVCIVVGPRLRWLPQRFIPSAERFMTPIGASLYWLSVVFFFTIVIAGMAGYFVCFWPGQQPLRRVLRWVFFTAAAGVGLMFARLVYLGAPSSSILESSGRAVSDEISWAWSLPWKTLSAYHICLLGLLLIGIFCFRLASGKSSLPLRVAPTGATGYLGDYELWERIKVLIWIVIGPLILIYGILGVSLTFSPTTLNFIQRPSFVPVAMTAMGLVMVGAALCVLPRASLGVLRNSLRWPGEKYILLAFTFPVSVAVIFAAGQYAFGLAYWTANKFAGLTRVEFRSYFSFDDTSFLFVVVLLIAAFTEEVIFRGLLQPTFVRRYGVYRGIFLVGMVWSAFHFPFDFSFSRLTDLGVIQQLSVRVFNCVALGFVLSWLTLGAGSVLPATLVHVLYNFSIYTDAGPIFPGKDYIRSGLWVALAYILFRYCPIASNEQPLVPSSVPTPELTP